MKTATLVVRYTIPGNAENRWIRLEQVKPETEAVSLEQAANTIDALYNTDPCATGKGLSGGGEAATEENEPDEEALEKAIAELLGPEMCNQCSEGWMATIHVFRSHQGTPYALRSNLARERTVMPVRHMVEERLEISGTSIDLGWPYAGRLETDAPANVRVTVRGSTLNLSAPVKNLAVRYETVYEEVTLQIPAVEPEPGSRERPQLQSASVVAFWGDLAAACDLEPPAQDDSIDQAELDEMCRKPNASYHGPGGCWKTIYNYQKCTCSGTEAPGAYETIEACECPPGFGSGAWIGTEKRLAGYRWCEGEEDEDLQNPEYYKGHCCHPPGTTLPRCRKTYQVYNGGAEIAGGAQSYRDVYGPTVRLVAVAPEGGTCGELIHEWEVPQENCCADVIPLSPAPGNPLVIQPGHGYEVKVLDGKPDTPLHWKAYGGIEFGPGVTEIENGGRQVHIQARADVCPAPRITVDDGCYPLEMIFEGEAGPAPELPNDVIAAPESRFVLEVGGGIPPFAWQLGSGLTLEATSLDGRRAIIKTGQANTWCVDTATAIDTCGRVTTAYVRNSTKGKWVPHDQFDRCAPMTGGGLITPIDTTNNDVYGYLNGYQYKVALGTNGYTVQGGCPSLQFCDSGLILTTNGEELITRRCRALPTTANYRYEAGCGCVGTIGTRTYRMAYGQYIQMVWEWYCGGEGT